MRQRASSLKELERRIHTLEADVDTTQFSIQLLMELVHIVGEIPAGQRIINRAINRQKLHNLVSNVLPRRKKQLSILSREKIPVPIKNMILNKEISLIRSTTRQIIHRKKFEDKASISVQKILSKALSYFKQTPKQLSKEP